MRLLGQLAVRAIGLLRVSLLPERLLSVGLLRGLRLLTKRLLVVSRLRCRLRRRLLIRLRRLLWRWSLRMLLRLLVLLLTVPLLLLLRLCVRLLLRMLRRLGLSMGGPGVGRRAGHALLIVLLVRVRRIVYACGVRCF